MSKKPDVPEGFTAAPPKPPGVRIKGMPPPPIYLDGGDLVVATHAMRRNVDPAHIPLKGARVETLDNTGRRMTVTRAMTIGLFALGAKKKTGTVKLIVVNDETGDCTTSLPYLANQRPTAQMALEWATAFNAWSGVQHGALPRDESTA